jgi:cell division protein ZipA
MDELTFLLILAGIGIVLLVAMFTYYRHHKKIHDEIQDFNRHHDMDDLLLDEKNRPAPYQELLNDDDLPSSFNANQDDNFDIDRIFNKSQTARAENVSTVSTNSVSTSPVSTSPVSSNPASTSFISSDIVSSDIISSDIVSRSIVSRSMNSKDNDSVDNSESLSATVPMPESIQQQVDNEIDKTDTAVSTSKPVASRTVSPQAKKLAPSQIHQQIQAKKQLQNIEVICEPTPKGVDDLILSFTIISRSGKITGQNLKKALEDSGLRFGVMDIFHYPGDKNPDTYALFSVANLVEPGIFNLQELDQFDTPGISLFMRLPTRKSAFVAFDEFIQVSRMLSQKLGGELCDETRNQLTQQCISHKKEQIKKLQFELAKAKKLAELNK